MALTSELFETTTPCTPSTSDPPRQKSCSICPATFTRKTHLDRHIRSRTSNLSFLDTILNLIPDMNERTYRCEASYFPTLMSFFIKFVIRHASFNLPEAICSPGTRRLAVKSTFVLYPHRPS